MKDPVYLIKTSIVVVLLAIESYLLTSTIFAYVRTEDYFTPPLETLGLISLLLLVLIFTYSLTVGAWKKWEQYLIVPLPISLGIFLALFLVNPTYAIVSSVLAYVLISYDVYLATHLKSLLLKFDARTILRTSTRGFLFLFAVIGGILVLVHSTEKADTFDISGVIANMAQDQVDNMMPSGMDEGEIPNDLLNQLEGKGLPISPEQFGMLSGMQGNSSSLISGLPTFNLDLRDSVKSEVDSIIEPYRQFIPPLIALMVFALIRFLGGIVHFVFNMTVPIVFGIARKVGWFHITYVTVQQEQLAYSPKQQLGSEPKESPNLTPRG